MAGVFTSPTFTTNLISEIADFFISYTKKLIASYHHRLSIIRFAEASSQQFSLSTILITPTFFTVSLHGTSSMPFWANLNVAQMLFRSHAAWEQ
jgi:hypothetical protein